jgi:hypothetical protein
MYTELFLDKFIGVAENRNNQSFFLWQELGFADRLKNT